MNDFSINDKLQQVIPNDQIFTEEEKTRQEQLYLFAIGSILELSNGVQPCFDDMSSNLTSERIEDENQDQIMNDEAGVSKEKLLSKLDDEAYVGELLVDTEMAGWDPIELKRFIRYVARDFNNQTISYWACSTKTEDQVKKLKDLTMDVVCVYKKIFELSPAETNSSLNMEEKNFIQFLAGFNSSGKTIQKYMPHRTKEVINAYLVQEGLTPPQSARPPRVLHTTFFHTYWS